MACWGHLSKYLRFSGQIVAYIYLVGSHVIKGTVLSKLFETCYLCFAEIVNLLSIKRVISIKVR